MKFARTALIAAALLSLAGAQSASAQQIILQIGSTAPVNSPWDLGLKKLAAEWSRVSGGRVRMVFPKSVSSASQEDLIQKMKFTLDGAVLDTTGLGFIENDVYFLSMPSVIRNDAEYDKAMAAAEPLIRRKLADRYELVATAKGGWIRFFSNQQIRTPEDLRKVRMGVNRNMESMTKLMQSIGVRTVKADSSSTLLQFNSGALDAMYSSPLFVGALWSQYKRVVSHMTPFSVSPFFGAILVNKRSWDKVPESLRPALRESAERVCKEIGAEAVRLEEEAIAAMKGGGLVVPPYSAEDAAAWDALYADKIKNVVVEWYSPEFTAAIYASMGR
ncbi:MAG: TRAP transporter substrate-binding protein DctP [Spirochaetes bacterium]|nr:TRAP transporter substrate-binding protein DctP [Spirochaetota bacterium]MBU1082114.1 TRAP transporter substrate-binding protein DctP [Spirochaetota bacterium]